MRKFILLLCFFGSFQATASGVTFHAYGGTTVSPKDDIDAKTTVGGVTTSVTDKTQGGTGMVLGADVTLQSPLWIGVAFAYEQTAFTPDKANKADTMKALYVIPRIQYSLPAIELWFGVGIGQITTSIGQTYSNSNGILSEIESPVSSSAISPRIGLDMGIGSFTLGAHVSYTMTNVDVKFDGLSMGSPMSGTQSNHRSWVSACVRLGYVLF